MWDIRITDVSDLHVKQLCEVIGGSSLAVREGAPFDSDIAPHIHLYVEKTDKSESYIRKKIQLIDTSRKGNALYRMSKSHENTPNYVLKHVYADTKGVLLTTLNHPRIVYHTPNLLNINYGQWYNQYVAYIESIKQTKSIKKKIKKDSTFQMILDIAERYSEEKHLQPNDFIPSVVEWHLERDLLLPSRSNMERYIITIYQKYKNNTDCVRSYYAINFQVY